MTLDASKSALMKVFVMSFSLLTALMRRIAGALGSPRNEAAALPACGPSSTLVFLRIMPKKYHLSRRC
jgi:hypothetical protein